MGKRRFFETLPRPRFTGQRLINPGEDSLNTLFIDRKQKGLFGRHVKVNGPGRHGCRGRKLPDGGCMIPLLGKS